MPDTAVKTEIKPKKPRRLTIKQIKFREAILKGESGKDAVYQAGYKVSNDNVARVIASENLTKPNIRSEINVRTAEIEQKTELSIEKCQKEHQMLADLALQKGDLATATRNIELKYKTIAAYAEKNINIGDEKTCIDENKRIEAERLAKIRLTQSA